MTCALCANESKHWPTHHPADIEFPDLDGRPSQRELLLHHRLHSCPSCGYCAQDLSVAHPSADAVVHSEAYRVLTGGLGRTFAVRQYLRRVMLTDAAEDREEAVVSRLRAAWVLEAGDKTKAARHYLSEAADLMLATPPPAHWEPSGDVDWKGWRGLQRVDVLRRANRHDEALREVARVREVRTSALVERLLSFEEAAIAREDTEPRGVREGLGIGPRLGNKEPRDPLLAYLFAYYRPRLTQMERRALFLEAYDTDAGPRWATDHPQVLALLAEGKEGLARHLERRLLAEHPDTVVINRCPKCGALARTPNARQCRACPHTWRETSP
ncbi:hypothetical protein MFU01_78080 [Myxococcus fulvus]|uniref:Uncharacterized protein n=1 Tax=Myxococcus fulvus TaxID=33 RepID=A0A511TF26_MYXFU|nr:hypothetical protein MFU01_78080 [Myxococcus fulvus]